MKHKQIAILGAGPSGIVAAKEAIAQGLMPTVLDKAEDLGGIWNPKTGSVWESMHTNLSKFACSFSDFAWPFETDTFPSSQDMFKYLQEYAKHFNLLNYIQFNSTVIKVSPANDSTWNVEWISSNHEKIVQNFEGVIVATGIFSIANVPDIKGMQDFTGQIIHSQKYKSSLSFKDSTVLVIGGSFSAAEIASDVADSAKQVVHSFHEPFWVLKRLLPKGIQDPTLLPIDLVFYNRKFYSQPPNPDPIDKITKKNNYMQSICQEQQGGELKIESEEFTKPVKVAISDGYLDKVKEGKITPKKADVIKLKDQAAIFQDGSKQKVDHIIFATGFKASLPFLDKKILDILQYDLNDQIQPLILYNATLHPDLPNMFFVGMYKGPYFAVIEQQARWSCGLLSGKVLLPSKEELNQGLSDELEIRNQTPRPQFPHPDYVKFADSLAEKAGSFLGIQKLQSMNWSFAEATGKDTEEIKKLEPFKTEICRHFMSGPATPYDYNLCDNPTAALKNINTVLEVVGESIIDIHEA